jgi:Tfp pilus assembly protein PilX
MSKTRVSFSSRAHLRSRGIERGSALILALLVILVLTVVGVGLSYMTTVEEKMAGNDQREKAGFYAAEVGLRQGEALLNGGSMQTTATVSALLTATPTAPSAGQSPSTIQPPGGGYPAVLLVLNSTTYRDMAVTMPSGVRDQASFSLYIRNDREDTGGTATSDKNLIINLISVGKVGTDTSGNTSIVMITKILEEQISSVNVGSEGGSQFLGNGGGTSSSSK